MGEELDKFKEAVGVAEQYKMDGVIQGYTVVNLTVPEKDAEIKNPQRINFEYVPFGNDNLFINNLADMARQSGFHRAILRRKYQFTIGDLMDGDKPLDLSLTGKFFTPLGGIGVPESIDNAIFDRYYFNNIYLVIKIAPKFGISIEHVDATKCRVTKDGLSVWVVPDWRDYQGSYVGKETKYAKYPNFKTLRGGIITTCLHIKDYEPEFDWYGVPSYMASLNTIAIVYKTDKWQISQLDNSMKIGGVMEIVGSLDPKTAKKLQTDIKAAYTGEGKNDKLIIIIKSPSQNTQGTQMIPFAQTKDGDWMELSDDKFSELIVAHDWYPSLMGRETNTGFDTKRVLNEYDIARTTTINPTRDKIIGKIREALQYFKRTEFDNVHIHSKMPFSFMADLDINSVLTIDEGRRLIGEQPLWDAKKGKEIINTAKTAHLNDAKLANAEGIKKPK